MEITDHSSFKIRMFTFMCENYYILKLVKVRAVQNYSGIVFLAFFFFYNIYLGLKTCGLSFFFFFGRLDFFLDAFKDLAFFITKKSFFAISSKVNVGK